MAFWTLTAMVAVLYALALWSLREPSAGTGVRRAGAWQPPAPHPPQAPRSLQLGSLHLFSDQAEGSEPAV